MTPLAFLFWSISLRQFVFHFCVCVSILVKGSSGGGNVTGASINIIFIVTFYALKKSALKQLFGLFAVHISLPTCMSAGVVVYNGKKLFLYQSHKSFNQFYASVSEAVRVPCNAMYTRRGILFLQTTISLTHTPRLTSIRQTLQLFQGRLATSRLWWNPCYYKKVTLFLSAEFGKFLRSGFGKRCIPKLDN